MTHHACVRSAARLSAAALGLLGLIALTRPALAAPGDLAPDRIATGVARGEGHVTEHYWWCGWRDFQGLVRFDLGAIGRRGYSSEFLSATLTFRRDWSAAEQAQIGDDRCPNRTLLIEEMEPGAGWVLDRGGRAYGGDDTWTVPVRAGGPIANRRSGDETFSVDVSAAVSGWLRGAPNAGFSLRLSPSALPGVGDGARPGDWVAKRCLHIYRDFALRVETAPPALGSDVTGNPSGGLLQRPPGGSDMGPTKPAARSMIVRGIASYSASVVVPASGQTIEALIGAARCGRTESPIGADGRFSLVVHADSSEHPGCGVAGRPDRERISFRIGPIAARQTATFIADGELHVDLSA